MSLNEITKKIEKNRPLSFKKIETIMKTILMENECHTIGNLLQKALSENQNVDYVSYRKRNDNVELFFKSKNNCDDSEINIMNETLHILESKLVKFSVQFQNEIRKKIDL